MTDATSASPLSPRRRRHDRLFQTCLALLGGSYVLLVVLLLAANAAFTTPAHVREVLVKPEIRQAIRLTAISCTISAILSLWIGTSLGYLLSRRRFRGKWIIDTLVDVPMVLPPIVVGLSLLMLFNLRVGSFQLEEWLQRRLHVQMTYGVGAVVLAQFSVACAFAVRTMRVAFDQINPRAEQVARTLGCSQFQAFWRVALPQAERGMSATFTVAWARSLGEFGPILVFAGATRMKTEVLSTAVFLELNTGNVESAVAVSLLMVVMAFLVLGVLRLIGAEVGR